MPVFKKWQEKYGDIFRIRMGSWDTVVLNGYTVIKQALERKDDSFSDRPMLYSIQTLRNAYAGHDSLALGPFNKSYLQLQKIIASALHRYTNKVVANTEELVQEEAAILNNEMLSWNGKPHLIEDEVQLSVTSVLYQILYGRGRNIREDKLFRKIVDSTNEFTRFSGSSNSLDVMPWLRHFMPQKSAKLLELMKVSVDAIPAKVKEHLDTFDKNHMRDIADVFLAEDIPDEVANDENEVSKNRLLYQLNELIGAGMETTTSTMMWLLTYMIAYPDIQARVQAEIDKTVGCGRGVGMNDREKLPYTEATILEALRLSSIAPLSVPHCAIRDAKLNGFDIDQNTIVLVNVHSANTDPQVWGSPETFYPERFLKSATDTEKDIDALDIGKSLSTIDFEISNRITSFGIGRRRCVGENLAKMIVFILFSNLMQRCELVKADTSPVDFTPVPGMVYKPVPFKVIVKER